MTVDKMRERKLELGYSYEKIAELANLPVGTVQNVLEGIIKSPSCETLKALKEVLNFKEEMVDSFAIREEVASYQVSKKQGEYTLEDYYAIPDEQRAELIDGVIYDMAAPSSLHQFISDEINMRFRQHVGRNKGKCMTVTSPIDVQLDCDDKTMVQPDVLIVCDRSRIKKRVVFGAPDLVVEVLSESTSKKDATIKLEKYMNAGVKEYWMVDPLKKRVYVYEFKKDVFPTMYTFEHKVPVGIFGGECEVDFSEIYDYVSFLYEEET